MNKYTRTQINQKAYLHSRHFVDYEDVLSLMSQLANYAVQAGADEEQLMAFFEKGGETDD